MRIVKCTQSVCLSQHRTKPFVQQDTLNFRGATKLDLTTTAIEVVWMRLNYISSACFVPINRTKYASYLYVSIYFFFFGFGATKLNGKLEFHMESRRNYCGTVCARNWTNATLLYGYHSYSEVEYLTFWICFLEGRSAHIKRVCSMVFAGIGLEQIRSVAATLSIDNILDLLFSAVRHHHEC